MGSRRLKVVYTMLSAQLLCNFSIRYMLAPLASVFIAAEYGYSEAQKAALLGAFFPGYMATQFPAGILAQIVGGKGVLTANLLGHASMLLALPAAARRGHRWVWCCLCAIGLSQGPMGPAQQKLKTAWLPAGPERAWGLQVINLGSKLAGPLTNSALPVVAATIGWQWVTTVIGAATAMFAVCWHRYASESPVAQLEAPQSSATSGKAVAKTKAIEWGVFRVWAVWSAFFMHLAENNSYYAIMQLSPQIFTNLLGVSPRNLGPYLAIAPAFNVGGAFVVASIEGALHKRKVPLLRIQKAMTVVAVSFEVVFLSLFAAVQLIPAWRSPIAATLACCGVMAGHVCHGSGVYTNYQDVGGEDSSIIVSVCNPLANIAGVAVPAGAAHFARTRGSVAPYFVLAAFGQAVAGVHFCFFASVRPARETVAQWRQASAARLE
eukprot:COSAG02_NODE_194_length_29788_cov_20.044090_11_plen_435_part_00